MKIVCNGQPWEVAENTTVAQLLIDWGIDPMQVAVEVNFDLVPRGQHAVHPLRAGDCLEIVTLVGGG